MTIPYLDPALPFLERQLSLEQNYNFRCTCPACSFESQLATKPTYSGDEPSETAIISLRDSLLEHTSLILTLPAHEVAESLNVLRDMHAIPEMLYPLFHQSVIPKLSEEFSKASHEGMVGRAMEVGHVLLAVYVLVYPPGYPQIGMSSFAISDSASTCLDPSLCSLL